MLGFWSGLLYSGFPDFAGGGLYVDKGVVVPTLGSSISGNYHLGISALHKTRPLKIEVSSSHLKQRHRCYTLNPKPKTLSPK